MHSQRSRFPKARRLHRATALSAAIEPWVRVVAIVAIPVVLAILGDTFTRSQQERALHREYVQIATGILQNAESNSPLLRFWAASLLEEMSPLGSTRNIAHKLATDPMTRVNEGGTTDTFAIFSRADTLTAPDGEIPADDYLRNLGITIVDVEPAKSRVVVQNNRSLYEALAAQPTVSQNILRQVGSVPCTYTLVFDVPVTSITIIRAELIPHSPSGVIHPKWTMSALDKRGRIRQQIGEPFIRQYFSLGRLPAQKFTVHAPYGEEIRALRIDGDLRDEEGVPRAAFASVLIEELVLTRRYLKR